MNKVIHTAFLIFSLTKFSHGQDRKPLNMETKEDLVEFRIASLTKHDTSFAKRLLNKDHDFLLVLEQVDNPSERIEMIIGQSEAAELGVAIEELKTQRPLPSEVLKAVIKELGFNLVKVVIDELKDGIFYSKMILTKGNQSVIIDSRPVDSITQAIRFNCKLFIARAVIEKNRP
jgi:bifunctional DNase/RNase